VVLTNNDAGTDDFWAIGSDGDPANPALLEDLSYYDWQGFWEPMADVYTGIGEGVLIPVVNYTVTSDFTASAMTICAGDAVTFTNTSSELYANRFFNLNAFDAYFMSETDSTFEWNFGDGSPVAVGANQTHTFTTPGTYTVMMSGEMLGWLDTCVDMKSTVITVMAAPLAAFSYDDSMSPTVAFTDASTASGTATYTWDFGDGNTSTTESPTHTYASPGMYTVTLTVTDMCGTVTTSQTVTLSSVGVADNAGLNVSASYVQSENLLYVTLPASANATIEVYNIDGKLISSESGVNAATKAISLDGVAAGTYVVRVKTANGLGSAKFSVIK
jgi:PKD repeat protein